MPSISLNPARGRLVLTGSSLSAETLATAAREGAVVDLAEQAWERIEASRRVVDAALASGMDLYGVTRGLGNRANEALPPDTLSGFSLATLRGRTTAVGEPLPAEVVRGLMLVRLNTLCLGRSGASRAVAESLRNVLNAGLAPAMPATGSIGASDLCVMAALGLALVGEGEFLAADGRGRRPASEVLAAHGLAPLVPGPKDGLVLCANSAHTAARAALALADGLRALETAQTTAAMSVEGYRGNPTPWDARVAAARPQPGQEWAAEGLRRRLAGSALYRPGGPRRLQDPLSVRCVAPTHGAGKAALDFLRAALEPELNGAGDNPVVLAEDHAVLSTGNFQMPLLTVALDAAGQALAHVALGVVGRCARLLSGGQAGLPENLSTRRPDGAGFAPLMKTAEALLAGIRHDAAATPPEASTTGGGVEDVTANAPLAAQKLQRVVDRLETLLAVEALTAAQAIDLAGVSRELPPAVAAAHEAVRARAAALDGDRPLGAAAERVSAELVRGGILAAPEQPA